MKEGNDALTPGTDWLELAGRSATLEAVGRANEKTARFGLTLPEKDAKLLLAERADQLREKGRVEFGEGILPQIMEAFCDSSFICQDDYAETLGRLQEIFYLYKNESLEECTDGELLDYMKQAFDGECGGSLEYLENTALESFARQIRARSRGFFGGKGDGEDEL